METLIFVHFSIRNYSIITYEYSFNRVDKYQFISSYIHQVRTSLFCWPRNMIFFKMFVFPCILETYFVSLKMKVFENALQAGEIWKHSFTVFCVDGEKKLF